MNARCAALLDLVEREDGISTARACKHLGWSRSELQRCLSLLGEDAGIGGLALLQVEATAGRELLHLSERARRARGRS